MQFDFTMAGYGSQNIETAGRFVKYVSGTGKIRVRFDKGGYIDLLPGQGCTGLDFSRLTIEDRTGAGNVGVLLAGAFMFQDDRVSGDVSIIDGGKNRTLANQTFMAASSLATVVAGAQATVELWNPAGSGKNVIVEQFSISSATASNIYAGWCGTDLAAGNAGAGSQPKKAKGAVSAALKKDINNLMTLPGDAMVLSTSNVQSNQTMVIALREPVVVVPGSGFFVSNVTVNNSLQTWIEFFEEGL